MSASNNLETSLLALLFNATPITNIADNAASSPSTNLYVSLHTSDPGEDGTQNSNETAYNSYSRVAVERTSNGWVVSGDTVKNKNTITFPECMGGTSTVTHVGIGTSSSGNGRLLFSGLLVASLNISNGITPAINPNALSVTVD